MISGVGISLKSDYYQAFTEGHPDVDWLEVHTENYLAPGGLNLHTLTTLATKYPISLHGVGLGLGSVCGISSSHLQRIKNLADQINPDFISEHLSWNATRSSHFNDLLPFPFHEETLNTISRHIMYAQNFLGRQILIENLTSYIQFSNNTMTEAEFINALVKITGCGILLDINNAYVNEINHGINAFEFINQLNLSAVKEIHLAGHQTREHLVIDSHGTTVCHEVWQLFEQVVQLMGPIPTMIEWDSNIPPLGTLVDEAQKAKAILAKYPKRPLAQHQDHRLIEIEPELLLNPLVKNSPNTNAADTPTRVERERML